MMISQYLQVLDSQRMATPGVLYLDSNSDIYVGQTNGTLLLSAVSSYTAAQVKQLTQDLFSIAQSMQVVVDSQDPAVNSINGKSGDVLITTSDITEGINEYFTNSRAVSALTGQPLSLFSNDKGFISSAPAVQWGQITGVISQQSDLMTQLNSKQAVISFPNDSTKFLNGSGQFSTPSAPVSNDFYVLGIQSAEAVSLTDGQTMFFGGVASKAPSTTSGNQVLIVPKSGTIKTVQVFSNAGTSGGSQSWSLYIRKNNLTDTLIGTVSSGNSNRTWSNTGLNISVSVGDTLEIKSVNPNWSPNPANVHFGGNVLIQV